MTRERKSVSGTAYPSVSQMVAAEGNPVPIALNLATILKLVAPALVAIVGAVAAGAYFYHDTKQHLKNAEIHMAVGERLRLESKADARAARKEMLTLLGKQHAMMIRELKVRQAEEIRASAKALTSDLRREQRKILKEVRETRRVFNE